MNFAIIELLTTLYKLMIVFYAYKCTELKNILGDERMSEAALEKLKSKYLNQKIIPFIGAGLSIPFKLKSWETLITELKEEFIENKALWPVVEEDLMRDDYLSAIDNIKHYGNVSEQNIQEKIADNYSIREIDIDTVANHNYADINKTNFKIFITTNYDKLIEEFISPEHSFNSLTGYTSNVQRLFENDDKYVFHLHGCVSNPEQIIISTEKYKEMYADPKFDAMMKFFSGSYSFLFLGFSFNDIFVKELIKTNKDYFKGTHFILVNKGDFNVHQKRELVHNYNLQLIEYDINESSHANEINKIFNYITDEVNVNKNSNSHSIQIETKLTIDDLLNSDDKEGNLFFQKLQLANVSTEMSELSKFFYIASEKFIRTTKKMGLPKDFIDNILAEVFMSYKQKYLEIYSLGKQSSEVLILEVHKQLESINIDRLIEASTKPTTAEAKGFIHILADDVQKDIWWGRDRLES